MLLRSFKGLEWHKGKKHRHRRLSLLLRGLLATSQSQSSALRLLANGANGMSEINTSRSGNRADRRQRSQGMQVGSTWHEHGALRVIKLRSRTGISCEGKQ